jgi:hypothetical protein
MIVKTLQIVWHEKLPVLSCDFHESGALATAGADKEVKARSAGSVSVLCTCNFRGSGRSSGRRGAGVASGAGWFRGRQRQLPREPDKSQQGGKLCSLQRCVAAR